MPCTSLEPFGLSLSSSYSEARVPPKAQVTIPFLCPDETALMQVWGSFGEEHFSYIRVRLKRCNQKRMPLNELCATD